MKSCQTGLKYLCTHTFTRKHILPGIHAVLIPAVCEIQIICIHDLPLVFSYMVYDFEFYCFHKIFGTISIFLAWVIDVLCDTSFDLHL